VPIEFADGLEVGCETQKTLGLLNNRKGEGKLTLKLEISSYGCKNLVCVKIPCRCEMAS
jgi:hypothetical protein